MENKHNYYREVTKESVSPIVLRTVQDAARDCAMQLQMHTPMVKYFVPASPREWVQDGSKPHYKTPTANDVLNGWCHFLTGIFVKVSRPPLAVYGTVCYEMYHWYQFKNKTIQSPQIMATGGNVARAEKGAIDFALGGLRPRS